MKNKLIFTVLFILFVMCISFAQVTTQIQDVLVNNQTTVSNCGLIDVGSTNNNTLTVAFKLSKLENQAVGTILVTVYLKRFVTSDPGTNMGVYSVPSNVWTTQFEGQIPINFSASEIELTGSSIYVKSTENGTFLSNSCEYPLKKTAVPTFTLTASSNSVTCGSTSPVTFTVNNVYNSPGTQENVWTISSGWLYNGFPAPSSLTLPSSTLVLTPSSYPPGSVSVVPKLNGVAYPQKTVSVTLSPFNPGYSIAGNNELCNSATYSISNLPSNITVVSWTSSNTNIATVTYNGNQATLNKVGSGTVSISAQVINSCGQPGTITKSNILVGSPTVTTTGITGGYANVSIDSHSNFSVDWVTGSNIQYYWTISLNNNGCTSSTVPKFQVSGTTTFTSNYTYATVLWGSCTGVFTLTAWAKNTCGDTYIGSKFVNVFNSSNNPCDRSSSNGDVKFFPNPIKNGGNLQYKEPPIAPCNRTASTKGVKEVKIYDMIGNLKFSNTYSGMEFSITNINLKSGNYIINVFNTYNANMIRELLVVD